MFWRRGWLVNSLKYHVEKELRETIYKNKEFKRLRWAPIQRLVVWGAQHLILSNTLILGIALIIPYLISEHYELLRVKFPSLNGVASIVAFQGDLIAVQATLVGLIFPLVIAFIGILLKDKSSNESLWAIYRHSSGFMLVGYSSLFLLFFYLGMKVGSPWLTVQQQVGVAIAVASWFGLNLILAIWFLDATMRFLSTKERMNIITQYGLNEVILCELRSRLPVLHYSLAQKMNLLPQGKKGWYSVVPHLDEESHYSVQSVLSDYAYVVNVWYRLLKFAMFFWIVQLAYVLKKDEEATLGLTIPVDGYQHKELKLAQVNVGKLNPISSFLIRNSITTSEKLDCDQLSFNVFLAALFDSVESALADNNSRAFDVAKSDLVESYRKIEETLAFVNDDERPDNWLFLSQGRMFSRNLLNEFVSEADGITQKVTRRLNEDSSYYETWCYVFIHLMRDDAVRPSQILETFISGHYRIWNSLMSWMTGNASDVSLTESIQDRALKHFIGSWEAWTFLKKDEFFTVNSSAFRSVVAHLESTSCMIISGMKHGNDYATRWAVDTLIYWYEVFLEDNLGYEYYSWHYELLTTSIVKEQNELLAPIVNGGEFDEVEGALIALANYWLDIRCLTAAYLMDSSLYLTMDSYCEYVDALLREKRLESTGAIELVHMSISNPTDLMTVYLRQVVGYKGSSWHRTVLSKHLDRLANVEEPEWVSGRVYSSTGAISDRYLPRFFKVIGVGLSKTEFTLSREWKEFLEADALSQIKKEQLIRDVKKLKEVDDTVVQLVCRQFELNEDKAREQVGHYTSSIEHIIQEIQGNIEAEIINAEIDELRLTEFGLAASERTFAKETGPLPIPLFKSLKYVADLDERLFQFNVTGYPKSSVSAGIDASRAINEKEWLQDAVKQQVNIFLFQEVLSKLEWKEASFQDDIELLQKVVTESQEISSRGNTPVLFVGPWRLVHLIDGALWGYAEEKEKLPFEVLKETGRESSYLCHLNGIEVYRHSFKRSPFSLLVAKESFEEIKIHQFGENQYVKIGFEPDSQGVKGTLTLSFGLNATFTNYDSFKYLSSNSGK